MSTITINSEQITSIANGLKSKGEQILTQYKDTCESALQMSTGCLQMTGLDTEQFFKGLESVYTKLNERVEALSEFLINSVAADYDALSQAITSSFNNDFANEFSALIGIGGIGKNGNSYTIQPIKSDEKIRIYAKKEFIENSGEGDFLPKTGSQRIESINIDTSTRLAVQPLIKVASDNAVSNTLVKGNYKVYSTVDGTLSKVSMEAAS